MGEKGPVVSVETVDLLIVSARQSGGVSSMLTWMFHRFVSLRVAYNIEYTTVDIT